jgi:hypothetical protein
MKAINAMFLWNPGTDQVRVVEYGKERDRGEHRMSAGACYSTWRNLNHEQFKMMLFIEAFHLIVRDRVDPDAVFREFYKINEFRDGLSEDFPAP